MWKKHIIWYSACDETPQYVDLFGDGKHELVMGVQPLSKLENDDNGQYKITTTENQGQMAYFTPGKDPTDLWEMHAISEPSAPASRFRALSGSRTASAPATSTATAEPT